MSGRPQPLRFIAPCLAQPAAVPPTGADWLHEIKYDGYRVQAHIDDGAVRLLTRRGLDWSGRFGRVEREFTRLGVRRAIIDGEAIVQDRRGVADFAALNVELDRGPSSRIAIMAFDLMHCDGRDWRRQPLASRKEKLRSILGRRPAGALLHFSDHMSGDGATLFERTCEMGLEGLVSKRADSPYRSGRLGDWIKSKCVRADPFVIVGYVVSAAASDMVGSLVLGYWDADTLVYAGRVGTGFSARVATALKSLLVPAPPPPFAAHLTGAQRKGVVWVAPSHVAQVEYRSWTADGILRHASFKDLRRDKPAREIERPASLRSADELSRG